MISDAARRGEEHDRTSDLDRLADPAERDLRHHVLQERRIDSAGAVPSVRMKGRRHGVDPDVVRPPFVGEAVRQGD